MSKVGLLPLYLKLYDDTAPEKRDNIEIFLKTVTDMLSKKGLQIIKSPVCRVKEEFEKSVNKFIREDADAVITLHLAYSPSLESSKALQSLDIPIIVLDTTPDYDFSHNQDPDKIMFNHGIHGVQDMCNLLLRNNVEYYICAGHLEHSNVLDRVCNYARAASMVKKFKSCNIGIIGKPFYGMGDFGIGFDVIKDTVGMNVTKFDFNEYKKYKDMITPDMIEDEYKKNLSDFNIEVDENFHKKSLIPNLAVRNWIKDKKLDGFTANFLDIKKENEISSMPFLEACKQMAKGKGYAGEGDVLTSGLIASLMSVYKETSFVEMFCPDWKNNSMFLSHMGEMNINLTNKKPVLTEKPFPYTDAKNPITPYGCYKEGEGVLVDLAPVANKKYNLILSKVKMIEPKAKDNMKYTVHGWFTPKQDLPDFMENYSKYGGTHHLAFVYTKQINVLKAFGKMMGFNTVTI